MRGTHWNPSSWRHKNTIVVDNTGSTHQLVDYQVRIVLAAPNFDFSKAQPDGRDLRFVDSDGKTLLNYWIESYEASAQRAVVWVRALSIPASRKLTLYLYYGNPQANPLTNGAATFDFFDDCEHGSAQEKWAVAIGSPTFEYVRYRDVFARPGGVWHASFAKTRRYPGNNTVYGGGHATYCAWTRPMAVYAPSHDKTFFVFGDEDNSPTISFYDHKTQRLAHAVTVAANPDMDAHKNPHLLIDEQGFIYIFYRSHCTPTHLCKSKRPYDISEWVPMGVVVERSSYPQPWQLRPGEITVLYRGGATHDATESLVRSSDGGKTWSSPQKIVSPPPKNGVYGVTIAETEKFPRKVHMAWSLTRGDWWQRYHVFYACSEDGGTTWRKSDGSQYALPITEPASEMIFESEVPDRGVWLKDIQLDSKGNPYILFVDGNSISYECRVLLAKRSAGQWVIRPIATCDHMYDDGALVVLADNDFRVYAPTTPSQPHIDGGEIEEWQSTDLGDTWTNTRHLTHGSPYSHNHVKTVFNHPKGDFRVFWNYGDATYPPKTRDVDLFYYGEDLTAPRKMDLSYNLEDIPSGRVLRVSQPEGIESAIRVKGIHMDNVAIEASARTGLPERQHPMLCLRMDEAPSFYGAGVPHGKGKAYMYKKTWTPLGEGAATQDPQVWQAWSFRAFEDRLQFAVDDRILVEARNSEVRGGSVGARVSRSSLYMANIRVRKFALPEPAAVLQRQE